MSPSAGRGGSRRVRVPDPERGEHPERGGARGGHEPQHARAPGLMDEDQEQAEAHAGHDRQHELLPRGALDPPAGRGQEPHADQRESEPRDPDGAGRPVQRRPHEHRNDRAHDARDRGGDAHPSRRERGVERQQTHRAARPRQDGPAERTRRRDRFPDQERDRHQQHDADTLRRRGDTERGRPPAREAAGEIPGSPARGRRQTERDRPEGGGLGRHRGRLGS